MEKIKKINLIFTIILILSMCFVHKTYARIDCSTNMTLSSSEVKQGQEFELTVGISNIQGENGVLIFGGTIEYDRNVLTLTGRSGEGDWSLSYNKSNGKFVADRNDGFATTNEKVLTLTFKVNENATGNTIITVKDTIVSDAKEEKAIGGLSKTVTIKTNNVDNPSGGNNQGGNQNNNGNQGGSSNSNGNSNQGNKPNNNNKPSNPSQGSSTNVDNDQNADNKPNNNNTINGIDTNRVNEENTVKDNNTVVKKTDYISKEEPVKLYKQADTNMIVYGLCAFRYYNCYWHGNICKEEIF